MRIANFEATGLPEAADWLKKNPGIDRNGLKKVLQMINVSFLLEGINRLQSMLICELKDSYVQQSQRYVVQSSEGCILPPELDSADRKRAERLLAKSFSLYAEMSALKEGTFSGRPKPENYCYGIPIEDARYILPLAVTTNVCVALSGDKLLDLFDLFFNPCYGKLFLPLAAALLNCLPESLRPFFTPADAETGYETEGFYQPYFSRITEENDVVLLDKFSKLDLKVGLGALTSTLGESPADRLIVWGDKAEEEARKVAERVLNYGHDSIAEQARTTFGLMCSLVTYHQQLRHRLTKNYRESLLTVLRQDLRIKLPPTIVNSSFETEFRQLAEEFKEFRDYLWDKYGQAAAFYFLLNCDQIKLVISSNARADISMLADRICLNAQWEIRELATKKLLLLRDLSSVLYEKALPACVLGKCREGRMCCGRQHEVRDKFLKER